MKLWSFSFLIILGSIGSRETRNRKFSGNIGKRENVKKALKDMEKSGKRKVTTRSLKNPIFHVS
eukprot:snap_masked-scaffold_2-processed-gene-10.13-mRNA-1 protein AED:1.00 eAED:1.00 QI:0/0/0/0/1/1/2/0/63